MRKLTRIPSWFFTGTILHRDRSLLSHYRKAIDALKKFGRVPTEDMLNVGMACETAAASYDKTFSELDRSTALIGDITLPLTDGAQIDYAVRSGKPTLLVYEADSKEGLYQKDWAKTSMPPPNLLVQPYVSLKDIETAVDSFCVSVLQQNPPLSGAYIVIEGGEGCGKTTQRQMLCDYLQKQGMEVIEKHEPGGTARTDIIRDLLQNPDKYREPLPPIAELLLYEAARNILLENEIKPALERGAIALSDRCYFSTNAYQGFGRQLGLHSIDLLNNLATRGIRPDMSIIIDIDPELGLKKTTTTEFGKKDRFEQEKIDFHQRVRQGYLEAAKRERNVHIISYIPGGLKEMHGQITAIVDSFLSENFKEK